MSEAVHQSIDIAELPESNPAAIICQDAITCFVVVVRFSPLNSWSQPADLRGDGPTSISPQRTQLVPMLIKEFVGHVVLPNLHIFGAMAVAHMLLR